MSNERLQGEDSFQSKNHFLEMPPSHAKMRLKSAPQKLNFLMAKAIQKGIHQIVATNCPCTRQSDNEIWSVNRI